MRHPLNQLLEIGTLRPIDVQAGMFLERLAGLSGTAYGDRPPWLSLAAAHTSLAVSQGHVCIPLDETIRFIKESGTETPSTTEHLAEVLMKLPVVGSPDSDAPLVLDNDNNLYLRRYHQYEQEIARNLLERAWTVDNFDYEKAAKVLGRLFSQQESDAAEPDHQLTAAALSLLSNLLVVSGGPGTGKTYTVARLLAAHIALSPVPLRIGLAAPTGKAAARLNESLQHAKSDIDPEVANHIPEEARTIHRLLRFQPRTRSFAYNKDNPLPLDLLIVDEASMIDVVLMSSLLAALPARCRLILFGDKHQLASVEAGNLFADICGKAKEERSPEVRKQLELLTNRRYPESAAVDRLDDSIVQLLKSYRFHPGSGIGVLASGVKKGDESEIERCLEGSFPDLAYYPAAGSTDGAIPTHFVKDHIAPIFEAKSPREALSRFERFRILCALHQGPEGVETINTMIEALLRQAGYIRGNNPQYAGKPIMILRNDYSLNLYNGDTGILLPDDSGTMQAWFPLGDGTMRRISPQRLPEHQTGYAITIHKSQGSEFEHVLLLLPASDAPILTRELLYTGITRARSRLIIVEKEQGALQKAARRAGRRFSGLADRLRGADRPGPSEQ